MKKKIIGALSIACCAVSALAFASCAAKIEEFSANESLRYVEIGETYNVPKPTVKDSKGNYHVPTVIATDPNGNETTVQNYKFDPNVIGNWTITYKITVGKETQTKSFTLEVYDETEPLVDLPLKWYNIAMPGATLDLTTITATDNSGENITPEITVYYNDEEVEAVDNVVTFSQLGTYVVNVKAEDSTGNDEERDYIVYTSVTYEDNIFAENQWYANGTSKKAAHKGERSMAISLFGNQPTYNWFNDSSLLGELYFYGNTDEKPYTHVSYWVYFDFKSLDINATALVAASWYEIENVYDIYGNAVAKNGDGKYEFSRNTWYRIVTDLTTLDDPVDHLDAAPITDCLMDYGIYFGLWNTDTNSNTFTKPVVTYIDDIRLIDPNNDDEVYDVSPLELAKQYDKGARLAYAKYGDMVNNVATANGEAVTLKAEDNTELVTYNFKHGFVDGTLSKFDSYGNNALGTDTSTAADAKDKKAFSSGWQAFTGNNDAFVYEITAKKTVFIDLQAQIAGTDGAEGATTGWHDSSIKSRVYIKTAEGELILVYDYMVSADTGTNANGYPQGFDITNILLREGCTLYYELSFPYEDHRNVSNPPYLNVYTATKKTA